MKISEMPVKIVKRNDMQEIYGSFVDSVEQGILMLDEEGYVLYANKKYEEIFRISREEIVGMKFTTIYNDELITKSFRMRKRIFGKLNYHIGKYDIKAEIAPVFHKSKFRGIIGLYDIVESDENKEVIRIYEENEEKLENPFEEFITNDQILIKELLMAKKAAKSKATILIRGESGTGKEVLAKQIHKASKRSEGPFIAVNCGAIPENLIESELFGHEKGSFTGAHCQKLGKFEMAEGGTIFLDEIGDLPLELQVKILRVLQEKEIERVGGCGTQKIDVRVIAATHRNLEEMIENNEFREDLYYRINVIPIQLTPLKDRGSDVILLADYFLKKYCEDMGIEELSFDKYVLDVFREYKWSGNVRELENVIERVCILTDGKVVDISDLPSNISNLYDFRKHNTKQSGLVNTKLNGEVATFEEYEKEIIAHAMKKFKSFNAAGKALGITHKTVAAKVRKYSIEI